MPFDRLIFSYSSSRSIFSYFWCSSFVLSYERDYFFCDFFRSRTNCFYLYNYSWRVLIITWSFAKISWSYFTESSFASFSAFILSFIIFVPNVITPASREVTVSSSDLSVLPFLDWLFCSLPSFNYRIYYFNCLIWDVLAESVLIYSMYFSMISIFGLFFLVFALESSLRRADNWKLNFSLRWLMVLYWMLYFLSAVSLYLLNSEIKIW